MPFLSKMISFWKNLFRRQQVEADLNDELQAYVEEMAERRSQAGVAPEAAREAVLQELGGIERIKDLVRQQRIGFGDYRRAAVIVVVALIAFVSGASTAVGVVRWHAAATVEQSSASAPPKTAPARERPPVLEGRVVDDATGEPIPYVEIGLHETPIRRFTYTDDMGHFVFTNPPSHFYSLESGTQRWAITHVSPLLSSCASSDPDKDFFEFQPSKAVSVKAKDGQPREGELVVFHGVIKGKPYPPPGQE